MLHHPCPPLQTNMGGPRDAASPPLEIVLGALSDLRAEDGPSPATAASDGACSPSSSPATFILGTSYFATPRVGATSSGGRRSVLGLNKDGRVPMEDRKGPLDQFKPRSLLLSVSCNLGSDALFWIASLSTTSLICKNEYHRLCA